MIAVIVIFPYSNQKISVVHTFTVTRFVFSITSNPFERRTVRQRLQKSAPIHSEYQLIYVCIKMLINQLTHI